MAKINRANPIDLSIENQYRDQATPVLYIVSGERPADPSQSILFRIKNVSKTDYALKAKNTADSSNYHFAFVFRPGTLHYVNKQEIQTKFSVALGADWKISPLTERSTDRTEVLYCSHTKGYQLNQNKEIIFIVNGLSAEGGVGSRSSQLQLHSNLPIGSEEFLCIRNKHLDIINHDGKTFAPLDFVILGDPTLIHKTDNNVVQIQMIEKEGRPINVSSSTYIDVKFPYYGGKPDKTKEGYVYGTVTDNYDPNYHPSWVLGKGSLVGNIQYQKDQMEETAIAVDPIGNDINYGYWGFRAIRLKFDALKSINNFITKFINVPAFGAVGDSVIKVSIRNLPGYWDTDFEVKIHKSLIATRYTEATKTNHSYIARDVEIDGHVNIGGKGNKNLKLRHIEGKHWDNAEDDTLYLNYYSKKDVHIGGHLNIGGAGNKTLTLRHIEGKHWNNTGNDTLYLNYFSEKNVEIGKSTNPISNLRVHGRIQDATGKIMPVGTVVAYGGSKAPLGWLLCNGTSISSGDQYKQLRALIGANTPDLRSRFIVGAGHGRNLSNYPLRHTGGEEKHSLSYDEMPSHSHSGKTNKDGGHSHTGQERHRADNDDNDCWGTYLGTNSRSNYRRDDVGTVHSGGSSHQHNFTTNNSGGGKSHNNLPPFYALTYIIKY